MFVFLRVVLIGCYITGSGYYYYYFDFDFVNQLCTIYHHHVHEWSCSALSPPPPLLPPSSSSSLSIIVVAAIISHTTGYRNHHGWKKSYTPETSQPETKWQSNKKTTTKIIWHSIDTSGVFGGIGYDGVYLDLYVAVSIILIMLVLMMFKWRWQ